MDVDRPSSSTPLLPGGGKGAPAIWLERLCICFIGAAATAPVYFILYCLGWLKLLQGNSVVLVLLVTFYPAGLVTLLLQMFYDYKFDTAYGRHRAMFVRFLISVSINVGLVPAILPHASNKTILYSMFIILGFANAACVGSLYEVCLQMPSQVKAVQYLSIGLQSGGVLAGVLGLATGFTTLEAELYIQANGTSLPFEAKAFAWSTCLLCLIGLASTTGAINRGPPEWGESLRAVCGPLALPIFTLIVTTSFTALTTGFYPFTPSAQYKDNPWQNSALVVILVYANQVFDLVGRGFTAQLSCPSANMLLYLTCARAGIVAPLFFLYIGQSLIYADAIPVLLIATLQVSHGMLQTWAFVHSAKPETLSQLSNIGVQEKKDLSSMSSGLEGDRANNCQESLEPDEDKGKELLPWVSKVLMISLQTAVVIGGIAGHGIVMLFGM